MGEQHRDNNWFIIEKYYIQVVFFQRSLFVLALSTVIKLANSAFVKSLYVTQGTAMYRKALFSITDHVFPSHLILSGAMADLVGYLRTAL